MATIRDVAKACGVSIATVSHVLNNRSSKVGEATRDRVLATVRELHYRPTAFEEKQKAIQTTNVGLLAGDIATPIFDNQYFQRVFEGALEMAALRGNSLTVFIERMWGDVGQSVRKSYDGRCDGVLMIAPESGNRVLKVLWERGTPIVSIGSTVFYTGVSSVDIDNVKVGSEGTKHLLDLGHRRIAYLGAHERSISSYERAQGYLSAMREVDSPLENICVIYAEESAQNGQPGGRRIVRKTLGKRIYRVEGWVPQMIESVMDSLMPDCTAFICWNDSMGREAVNQLAKRKLFVPKEISVISVDDTPFAVSSHPFLTTFRQPLELLGRTAVNVLIDHVCDPALPAQVVRYTPELIVRESTGAPCS